MSCEEDRDRKREHGGNVLMYDCMWFIASQLCELFLFTILWCQLVILVRPIRYEELGLSQ
jgi:hypothetical protein